MLLRWAYRGRIASVVFVIAVANPATRSVVAAPSLFTAGNTFTTSSHYVSTDFFTWNTSTSGQFSGPWAPLEGRAAWDGTPAYFEQQIKQVMMADIDVMLVPVYSSDPGPGGQGHLPGNVNFFQGLSNLRAQGYNVPKVAPFLDTNLSANWGWPNQAAGTPVDLGTTAGKDSFVTVLSNFYKDYYSVNTDAYADSYIGQLSGRPLMSCWQFWSNTSPQGVPPGMIVNSANATSLTRADVQTRLQSALGAQHALFNNMPTTGTFIIGSDNGDQLSFRDEVLTQFEANGDYYDRSTYAGAAGYRAAKVEAGFWNQNVSNPGMFAARAGGVNYSNAWTSAQNARAGSSGVKHVNVESWNEYDEGSGIYAANPGPPYIKPGSGNTNTDTWSSTNDPYQYIKTTAAGARQFNDTTDRGATILWNNLPTAMGPGQTLTAQVIVRNDGDVSWTGAAGFKLGELNDPTMFGPGRYLIDDASNEIPTYGGIFRGRPITFDVQLTAPTTFGAYTTHWQMVDENVAWFGQELTSQIAVALYGDANLDSKVDVLDLAILAANYRKQVTGGWTQADFNNDGVVDVKDLARLAANYRHSLASTISLGPVAWDAEAIELLSLAGVTVTPEPGTLTLLVVSLAGLAVYRLRRRMK